MFAIWLVSLASALLVDGDKAQEQGVPLMTFEDWGEFRRKSVVGAVWLFAPHLARYYSKWLSDALNSEEVRSALDDFHALEYEAQEFHSDASGRVMTQLRKDVYSAVKTWVDSHRQSVGGPDYVMDVPLPASGQPGWSHVPLPGHRPPHWGQTLPDSVVESIKARLLRSTSYAESDAIIGLLGVPWNYAWYGDQEITGHIQHLVAEAAEDEIEECPECGAETEATGGPFADGTYQLCPACGWDSSPADDEARVIVQILASNLLPDREPSEAELELLVSIVGELVEHQHPDANVDINVHWSTQGVQPSSLNGVPSVGLFRIERQAWQRWLREIGPGAIEDDEPPDEAPDGFPDIWAP